MEGWKSSRRKRQEHVIERVTEVKRMEQEEALKASEAATKLLINNRFTPIHRLQWLDLLYPDINELW